MKNTEAKNKVCWYRNGMNKHLSSKGYVHFSAKVPMDEDFAEGEPYTFNEAEKTFGKADIVLDIQEGRQVTEQLIIEMNRREDGQSNNDMTLCEHCHSQWSMNNQFCGHCGNQQQPRGRH